MSNTIGLSDVSNMERQRNVEESGLSRHIWDVEHAGSNPAIPTIGSVEANEVCDEHTSTTYWNIAQLVRASV